MDDDIAAALGGPPQPSTLSKVHQAEREGLSLEAMLTQAIEQLKNEGESWSPDQQEAPQAQRPQQSVMNFKPIGELRPYEPTWRDKLASATLAAGNPSRTRAGISRKILGSAGGGTSQDPSMIDYAPVAGTALQAQEAYQQGNPDVATATAASALAPGAAPMIKKTMGKYLPKFKQWVRENPKAAVSLLGSLGLGSAVANIPQAGQAEEKSTIPSVEERLQKFMETPAAQEMLNRVGNKGRNRLIEGWRKVAEDSFAKDYGRGQAEKKEEEGKPAIEKYPWLRPVTLGAGAVASGLTGYKMNKAGQKFFGQQAAGVDKSLAAASKAMKGTPKFKPDVSKAYNALTSAGGEAKGMGSRYINPLGALGMAAGPLEGLGLTYLPQEFDLAMPTDSRAYQEAIKSRDMSDPEARKRFLINAAASGIPAAGGFFSSLAKMPSDPRGKIGPAWQAFAQKWPNSPLPKSPYTKEARQDAVLWREAAEKAARAKSRLKSPRPKIEKDTP
jgi:hypothetical protein